MSDYPFLNEVIPVTLQQWDDSILPLVSVSCSTFMHENFIRNAIDGFLMQCTNFKIEILIKDDASTDKTANIVKEYEARYPLLIKPTYQIENQFGRKEKTSKYVPPHKRIGKYIAFCEGDDYWNDPYKLQKQVDFLEANNDFAICHHNMQVIYEGIDKEPHLSNKPEQKEITTIVDLAHGNYIFTASCLFRNGLFGEYPDWFYECPIGDYPTHMLNAQYGKIKYFPEVMGTYRVHKGGIWENKDMDYRIDKWIDLLEIMKDKFSDEINSILLDSQNVNCKYLIDNFNNQDKIKKSSLKLIENNPFYLKKFHSDLRNKDKIILQKEIELNQYKNETQQKDEEIRKNSQYINQIDDEIKKKNNELNELNYKIENIFNSKSWKLTKPLRIISSVFK